MPLQILLLYIAALANIVLGLVVFYRTYTKPYGWFFGLTMLGVALWAIGDIAILESSRPFFVAIAERLFYASPMIIPVSIWFFGLTYPSRKLSRTVAIAGSTILAVGVLIVSIFPNAILTGVDVSQRLSSLNIPEPRLPYFYAYAAYFSIIFLFAYIALFYSYRREQELLPRIQLKYTFYGVIFASIPALLTNLTLPANGVATLIWLGPIFTTVFVVTIALSIVQHKMFDIRLVIARSLGYLSSLLVVAALYGFIVFGVAQIIFGFKFNLGSQILLSSATAISALSFGTIKKRFDRITNQLFYRDSYSAEDLFDKLNRSLVSTVNLDHLLLEVSVLLSTNLKTEFCFIGLKEITGRQQRLVGTDKRVIKAEDVKRLRRLTVHHHRSVINVDSLDNDNDSELKGIMLTNDFAVLVRLAPNLLHNEEGLGYLILGAKKSGNPYSAQDVRMLESVANELIIAIQNALHFEEIQNFNQTLQEKIATATRELRRTNEKLKAMDETKDDFISMASHQLRTPLTSVKGYLSMVLEGDAGKLTVTERKMLTQAFISSQRMVYLIADLLNVSRLKTGKFIIEGKPINLAAVIGEEINQVQETAASRSVSLTYEEPKQFPELLFDETKTRQVIMNFIDNAIYYTPPGGHIQVELIDNPTTVELHVVDDGMGVPKSEQAHLFTKFYRAGNARQARPDGTGLGLFMAKKVVLAQGGAIVFHSKEGVGSTFGFTFSKSKLAVPVTEAGKI